MKKIIQICSIVLLMGCFVQDAKALGFYYLLFGKTSDCKGWGICDIRWAEVKIAKPVNQAQLALLPNGHLSVTFDAQTISPTLKQQYFSTGNFIMETPFLIFGEVQQSLGLKDAYTIQKGTYPIKYDTNNNSINIIF